MSSQFVVHLLTSNVHFVYVTLLNSSRFYIFFRHSLSLSLSAIYIHDHVNKLICVIPLCMGNYVATLFTALPRTHTHTPVQSYPFNVLYNKRHACYYSISQLLLPFYYESLLLAAKVQLSHHCVCWLM